MPGLVLGTWYFYTFQTRTKTKAKTNKNKTYPPPNLIKVRSLTCTITICLLILIVVVCIQTKHLYWGCIFFKQYIKFIANVTLILALDLKRCLLYYFKMAIRILVKLKKNYRLFMFKKEIISLLFPVKKIVLAKK